MRRPRRTILLPLLACLAALALPVVSGALTAHADGERAADPARQLSGKWVMSPYIWDTAENPLVVAARVSETGEVETRTFEDDQAAASAWADTITVPAIGKSGSVSTADGERCLTRGATRPLRFASCDATSSQRFKLQAVRYGKYSGFALASTAGGIIDLAANDLVVVSNPNDFSTNVFSDAAGLEPVHRPIEAHARFPDDGSEVVVTGTAEPDAEVRITEDDGTVVAGRQADEDGEFELTVPAPDRGGVYRLHVSQIVSGDPVDDFLLPLDYGAAVSIEDPQDGADISGGSVTMHGRGAPGSTIAVSDNGKELGTTTVELDGTWTFTTPPLSSATPGGV